MLITSCPLSTGSRPIGSDYALPSLPNSNPLRPKQMKNMIRYTATLLAFTSFAAGEVLLQWTPFFGTAPYFSIAQTPPPTLEAFGVTSSPLARVNRVGFFTNLLNWPGNVSNIAGEPGVLDPINGAYTEFTVTPPLGGSVTYTSISYQLSSVNGMNTPEGYTGFLRTSLDAFAEDVATMTITNQTNGNFVFDISSIGEQSAPVVFRLYFVNNNAAAGFADLAPLNGGLIVNGMSSETDRVAESITWTGADSSAWETNGLAPNWISSDGTFRAGDSVLFDDTADANFAGLVEITDFVSPGAIVVDSDLIDYEITGFLAGSGLLQKTGASTLLMRTGAGLFPFAGAIDIQEGVLELIGASEGFDGVTSLTVGPNGTFRVAAENTGRDRLPPMTLAGGNIELNDRLFIFPTGRSITLAAGTTSTISGSALVSLFSAGTVGEGNLVKTGGGILENNRGFLNGLGHTGTTSITGGIITFGAANTSSSSTWTIQNGRLDLSADLAAPIANLPVGTTISLNGNGVLDVEDNVETLASLTMDSTTGQNLFITDATDATLTVTDLILSGSNNQVIFEPNLLEDSSGVFPVLTAANVVGELGTNLTVFGVSPQAQTWTRNAATGLISVAIDLSQNPPSLTYTNASGAGVWSQGGLQDWATPTGPAAQFFNFIPTFLGDEAFTAPGTLAVQIENNLRPPSVVFNNSPGNDYSIFGLPIIGSSTLTVQGGGRVTLNNANTFTGETIVDGGSTLLLNEQDAVSPVSPVIVESGSTLEILTINGLFRDAPTDAAVTLNGGTLLQSAGFHLNLNTVNLNSGATWTATSPNSFDGENVQILTEIAVGGTSPSQIGPFTFGLGLASESNELGLGGVDFEIADASGDSGVDLTVTAQLENAAGVSGGLTKRGLGTMLMTAENIYTAPTGVFDGTLLISSAASIPQNGLGTLIFSTGQFGFVTSAMTDAEIVTIANTVSFDEFDFPAIGSLTFFVPAGETATFAGDLTGGAFADSGAGITVQGGGTLNFAGATLPVTPTTDDNSTIVGVGDAGVVPATVINDFTIATSPGSAAGIQATLTFVADGAVDVYTSTDLVTFTQVLTSATSPVVLDDLSPATQFFVAVSAGSQFPLER